MNVKRLLDFIGKYEGRGDYNIVYGGIKPHHRPPKPLVKMTIGEVLAWQDSIDPLYMSEAAGKYQIMEDTLRGMYRDAGVKLTDLFDESMQDYLATFLLRRRGLTDYLAGRIDAVKFAQSISKEWASMPCTIKDRQGRPARGQSYYAGDGLNKAHVGIAAFLDAVASVKEDSSPPVEMFPPGKSTGWARLLEIVTRLLRRLRP